MPRLNPSASIVRAALLAALVAGCSVDPTKLVCMNSNECPTGYQCDGATQKCATSGRKTLGVTASKIRLVKRPYADGSVRTTVSADRGAITSTPDFGGVTLALMSGSNVLRSSDVNADGSAPAFEIEGAPTQVSLAVMDRTGVVVPVHGYAQRVAMSFLGSDLAGTQNPIKAWDAGSVNNAQYAPGAWVQYGSGPTGSEITPIPLTSTMQTPGNAYSQPASYGAYAAEDGAYGSTTPPITPDRNGATALGWERLAFGSTLELPAVAPPARVGQAFGSVNYLQVGSAYYNFAMYGGAMPTVNGTPSDALGTFYAFDGGNAGGWALVQPPTSATLTSQGWTYPSTSYSSVGVTAPAGKAGAAMSFGSSYNECTTCTGTFWVVNWPLLVAGGITSGTSMTPNVYAYGDRIQFFTGGRNTYTGWWDLTALNSTVKLPFANAGMASAWGYNVWSTLSSGTQTMATMYIGGLGNTPSRNDTDGCTLINHHFVSPAAQYQVGSCVDANWATATGAIGWRTDASLAASDQYDGIFYLFGGAQGITVGGPKTYKNDLWQSNIVTTCTGTTAPPPCTGTSTPTRSITWGLVPGITGTLPAARSGASLVFADSRRLWLIGGTDANGAALSDVWELDLVPGVRRWRQVTLAAAPALAPGGRIGASAVGTSQVALLYGGSRGSAPASEIWQLSKIGASRLLVKAPAGVADVAAASNVSLDVLIHGDYYTGAVFAWDGSAWRWIASPGNYGLATATIPDAASYLQPDGSVYILLVSTSRTGWWGANAGDFVAFDDLEITLDFQ